MTFFGQAVSLTAYVKCEEGKSITQTKLILFASTDYLISRAEATLGSIDKVKKGHGDYLKNMGGEIIFSTYFLFSFLIES